MDNLIHAHIYEPHKPSLFGKNSKSERSKLHLYSCEKHAYCDAHKNGTCINAHNVFGAKCPNGTMDIIEGYTQRAKGYYKQIDEWKDRYSEVLWKLKQAPKRVVKVAGGWMLPYAHINMDASIPFHGKAGFMLNGSPFLSDEDFNKENFDKMIKNRPQAMFGGEIESYQKEQVPKFVKDLADNYPDKFDEVKTDRALEIISAYDYKGRKAYLKTIAPNVELTISKKIWWWDGEKISIKGKSVAIIDPISFVDCYAEYTPDDNATIVITDNSQVCEKTKFAD